MATPLRPVMMLRLVAGRGAFRGTVQAMTLVLLATWGARTYGEFANAWGMWMWLVFLPTAAEKAALKILPRTRLTTPSLAGLTLRIAATPVAVVALALVVALVVAPSSTVALHLSTATWSGCTGLLMTVSGMHRLRGRPGLDALAFAIAAGVVVVVTTTTFFVDLSPHVHLAALLCPVAVLIGWMIQALPREWVRAALPARRRLRVAFARSTVLLGLTELLDAVTMSLIFVALAVTGRVVDSGPFHITLLASSALCALVLYQLKLHQPATSRRLRGSAGAEGKAKAARLLRVIELAGLAFAVALTALLVVPGTRSLLVSGQGPAMAPHDYVVLAVLVVIEMPLAILLLYANYLVENTDSRVLSRTAGAAVLRLVATVGCAFALTPALGAVGGFCAITLGLAAEAAVLRRLLADRTAPPRREVPTSK